MRCSWVSMGMILLEIPKLSRLHKWKRQNIWWQFWSVGDRFGHFNHKHSHSFLKSLISQYLDHKTNQITVAVLHIQANIWRIHQRHNNHQWYWCYWQGTEIDPGICKLPENLFYRCIRKSRSNNPQKPQYEGSPTQGHVIIQLWKIKSKKSGNK